MGITQNEAVGFEAILSKRKVGAKLVFVSGAFNVVHSGHVRLFNFGAECGDILVVGVNSDGTPGSIVPEKLRLEAVGAISVVDYAFIIESSVEDVLLELEPDIVVKGKEHEFSDNVEARILSQYEGKLLFGSADTRFSSKELLTKEINDTPSLRNHLPVNFMNRHQVTLDELSKTLDDISKLKVVVVGDVIVDEYIACEPLGMSQEDPTIVVSPLALQTFLGGAGIVAAHVVGLGGKCDLVTITGVDAAASFVDQKLDEFGVNRHLIADDTRPTTVKKRFRAQGKTLLRVNDLRQHEISSTLMEEFLVVTIPLIKQSDLLIFSDFNYGCLPQELVDQIISACKDANVLMAADSQSSSQYGNIARYRNMKLVTPTEREARLAVGDRSAGLVNLASQLQAISDAENVLMTLGSEGMFIQTKIENEYQELMSDRIGALNPNPVDVAGAGDSMLVASAMSLATGSSIWHASLMGSIAAAIQVARLGNVPITAVEVKSELRG